MAICNWPGSLAYIYIMPAGGSQQGTLAVFGPADGRQNGGTLAERLSQMAHLVTSECHRVDVKHVDSNRHTEAEIISQLEGVQVLIPYAISNAAINFAGLRQLVSKLPALRLVQLMSAGFDHVNVRELSELGVAVANNGGSNAVAVAEHAIGLMLSLLRRLPEGYSHVATGGWSSGGSVLPELPVRRELNGLTVGIVGFGNVGRQTARRLHGFDVELLYYDPLELMPGRDGELFAEACATLDELLSRADIVTLHVPLSSETHHMIGVQELQRMKSNAILINTCRGPVIDESALAEAIQSGAIAGAGLDVTAVEPLPKDSPLLPLLRCGISGDDENDPSGPAGLELNQRLLVTPHIAGDAAQRGIRESRFALRQAVRLRCFSIIAVFAIVIVFVLVLFHSIRDDVCMMR